MAPSWIEKFVVREDATPDERRSTETPATEIHYTALAGHRRILGMKGDRTPKYEVTRKAILAAWGDKCHVKSVERDTEIAVLDFHSFPPKTDIDFTQRKHKIDIKGNVGPFEVSGGLGELHWKPTGMVPYGKASWELRDEGNLVVSVTIDDNQANGVVSIWKSDLDPEVVEELIVVGISKIEEYRRLMRNSRMASVSVASNVTWLAL
ncbi:hypothetical protein ACLX1H_005927 [Fusarium chlamydosporum]